MFWLAETRFLAASMLHGAGVFPRPGDRCLEVGFGRQGWLGSLISWGVREMDLSGIELNAQRMKAAHDVLPLADLRLGDASALPWDNRTFSLVIVSTVFTSILDRDVRQWVAEEITRVLVPGGALLWYDFAYNNPRNPHVRGIKRREIQRLFPTLRGHVRRTTLAPPLARRIVPVSRTLALALEAIPLLRTHLMGVLLKPSEDAT
jgi:ubiquinone/menaquinone biosynthesis C-methylase UbiE